MKNKQAIYFLFAANSISGFAQGVSMIAIPWYFSNILELPSVFGNIYFLVSLISLFWGLYAGSLIDKFNRQKIFIVNSIIGCLIVLSVSLYGFFEGQLPATLVAVVFASTFFIYNIHYPNLFAFAQEITAPKDYGRIISWIEIQGQLTIAIAGAFAAILLQGTENGTVNLFGFQVPICLKIRPWEMHEIFLMDASTYVVAIFLILSIKYEPVAKRLKEYTSVITRIRTGLNFLKAHSLIFIFGSASHSIFVTVLIIGFFLKPIYIKNHLQQGADVYASFEMYFALGSIIAGIAITSIFRWTSTVMAVIILFLVTTTIYYINMVNTNLMVFYLISLLVGFSNAGTRVMRMTYLFRRIPNQIIGRTGSVFMSINVIFRLFFIFILSRSFFVTGGNIIYSFGILGTFILIAAIVLMLYYKRLLSIPYKEPLEEG